MDKRVDGWWSARADCQDENKNSFWYSLKWKIDRVKAIQGLETEIKMEISIFW